MQSIDKTIEIEAPVSDVYARWSRFESFPEFMDGIQEVRQLDEKHLHWVMQMGGRKKEWDAEIIEHIPDRRISWRATNGTPNSGTVSFIPQGHNHTLLRLQMQYEPQGAAEKSADALDLVSRRIEADLERFRETMQAAKTDGERDENGESTFVRGYGTSGRSGVT